MVSQTRLYSLILFGMNDFLIWRKIDSLYQFAFDKLLLVRSDRKKMRYAGKLMFSGVLY